MIKESMSTCVCISLILLLLNSSLERVWAQDDATPVYTPDGDTYCLVCHTDNDQLLTFADGTTHELSVAPNEIQESVHGVSAGDESLTCNDCHQDYVYPHEPVSVSNQRSYTIQQSLACATCHEDQTEQLLNGIHYSALIEGNQRAATCVDCHGAHDTQAIKDRPIWASSQTCGDCHTTTFDQYQDSVHGKALFEGDENLPQCIACHSVHDIQQPTTALFRNRSPQLCATCHADEELMAVYEISTNVFDSYLSDFHGSTVSLFEQLDPNTHTSKAVCYDCHGVHNITPADDTKSLVAKENLLSTCQQCHPNATTDFPDSWVGHFEPSIEEYPVLFGVDIFYKILFPVVLIGFAGLIATDVFRRIRQRAIGGDDNA